MINLQPFCSTEKSRFTLQQPWSGGEYTYASNGHILVRVKRVEGVTKEQPTITDMVESWLAKAPSEPMVPMPKADVPSVEMIDCLSCEGTGKAHPDCGNCCCQCEDCEGKGETEGERRIVQVFDEFFNAQYWRMIMALPNPYIATGVNSLGHFHFTFNVGRGILMPMNKNVLGKAEKRAAIVVAPPKQTAA